MYDIYGTMQSIADKNNAFNVQQADKQMNFQKQESQKMRDFNSKEAQVSRDWQEMMSNTAHQREVNDLKKAGLNPILSAGGQGSAVTSGATASQGGTGQGSKAEAQDIVPALASLVASSINSSATIAAASIAANASMENARLSADTQKYAIDKNFLSGIFSNTTSALNARVSANAQKYSANLSADASKYTSDSNLLNNLFGPLFNPEKQRSNMKKNLSKKDNYGKPLKPLKTSGTKR